MTCVSVYGIFFWVDEYVCVGCSSSGNKDEQVEESQVFRLKEKECRNLFEQTRKGHYSCLGWMALQNLLYRF
jgi:hypothetical protein